MRIHLPHYLKPRTDLGGISGENPGDGLVRPMREFANSATKTSGKLLEPKTYDEAINDSVHGNRGRKAINMEV